LNDLNYGVVETLREGVKKMYKCCSCGKEFDPNRYVPDTCKCGGGVVEASDQNHFDWMSEYDSDGF
jgi:hypothetical protein